MLVKQIHHSIDFILAKSSLSAITEDLTEIIPKRQLEKINGDPEKSAKAFNLLYVTDVDTGILRCEKGSKFSYLLNDTTVKDKDTLARIKSLVIPPAWKNVWICSVENGHLQCTGIDVKNRKQYRYHPLWNAMRSQTKFYRLHQFGKALPAMRLQIEKDIATQGLTRQRILAVVVSLMERTNIRVGNSMYEKLYGSYGITTLKDKHVTFEGNKVAFSFVGKKGIKHSITLHNKKMASIVKQCRDIPGKELFQYYDDNGKHCAVDSGMVNDYIKTISGGDYSAKDFRTWAGTVEALLAFKELGFYNSKTEIKKTIVEALDRVSAQLGNTRSVCKKYYVHPAMLSLYEDRTLEKYIKRLDAIEKNDNKTNLTSEEKLVMQILEKY